MIRRLRRYAVECLYCLICSLRLENQQASALGHSVGRGRLWASIYLHKSEYLVLSLDAKTTAFFHSNGAAVWL